MAEGKILEIGQKRSRTAFLSLHEEMNEAIDYVEALMDRAGELTGVPTGFKDLDETTGGLQPGELIVIAARPSMGKTAMALNIARNAAVDHGKKVAIFSLEMTKLSLDAAPALLGGARRLLELSQGLRHAPATTRSSSRRRRSSPTPTSGSTTAAW